MYLSFSVVQVESLTAARKAALSGTEPSDAIRVVNALLTQIDHIKKYVAMFWDGSGLSVSVVCIRNQGEQKSTALFISGVRVFQCCAHCRYSNVIILTTSNITGAIDLAFVDRADIKQYIGLPSAIAIYKIYQSCLAELMKVRFPLVFQKKKKKRKKNCIRRASRQFLFPRNGNDELPLQLIASSGERELGYCLPVFLLPGDFC